MQAHELLIEEVNDQLKKQSGRSKITTEDWERLGIKLVYSIKRDSFWVEQNGKPCTRVVEANPVPSLLLTAEMINEFLEGHGFRGIGGNLINKK